MQKKLKSKKSKVPTITEEEYTQYLQRLKRADTGEETVKSLPKTP